MGGREVGWKGISLLQLVFIVLNAFCFEFSFKHLVLIIFFRFLSVLFHSLAPWILIDLAANSVEWPVILVRLAPFLVFLL